LSGYLTGEPPPIPLEFLDEGVEERYDVAAVELGGQQQELGVSRRVDERDHPRAGADHALIGER
jgi:hypothetical protein